MARKLGTYTATTLGILVLLSIVPARPFAQDQQQSASEEQAGEPLTEEQLEILVARIALYPDELVAAISAASLFPLQVVDAARYLENVKTKPELKPKQSWDGSVVSLLNYPEVINMMSEDLDWTQQLGQALTYQQKDVLIAIQQLRDEAVANGIIKTDEKIKVVEQDDNVVIEPAEPDVVYVPQYEPQMLYEPNYQPAPVAYYPNPYPNYYYPTAPYFAGFVTGAIWGAAVDWDDWGVWGGNWGNDVDIDVDCNNCFNNIDFNGKMNWNDVDWTNVDRSKIKFDKNQFAKLDQKQLKNNLKANDRNSLKNKSAGLKETRATGLSARTNQAKDIRKGVSEGLKPAERKGAGGANANRPNKAAGERNAGKIDRSANRPKPAARADNRPQKPSPLGSVDSGKRERISSKRGGESMGGGMRGGNKPHKRQARGGGGGRGRR